VRQRRLQLGHVADIRRPLEGQQAKDSARIGFSAVDAPHAELLLALFDRFGAGTSVSLMFPLATSSFQGRLGPPSVLHVAFIAAPRSLTTMRPC